MPGVTDAELATFLDEPGHLLRLGTNGVDGIPRVVPIWFIHRDDSFCFTPERGENPLAVWGRRYDHRA